MVAYVPPKQAGKYKAVASGAITNGKPVVVNSTGTVSVPLPDLTQTLNSAVVLSVDTSLTIGQQYFVQTDGSLDTSADDPSVIAGTAIGASDIIVKG